MWSNSPREANWHSVNLSGQKRLGMKALVCARVDLERGLAENLEGAK
jgi:hypothetical protein